MCPYAWASRTESLHVSISLFHPHEHAHRHKETTQANFLGGEICHAHRHAHACLETQLYTSVSTICVDTKYNGRATWAIILFCLSVTNLLLDSKTPAVTGPGKPRDKDIKLLFLNLACLLAAFFLSQHVMPAGRNSRDSLFQAIWLVEDVTGTITRTSIGSLNRNLF